MPAPATAAELLELLKKSGILAPEALARHVAAGELPADPVKCAGALVRQGVLTPFQAKLLLAGRYRGFKLGPYVVRDQLGQGGMGAVYLAEHATLRRKVAVKVLAPTEGMNKVAVERFLREARAAAALDHPNIVRIFDVAQQGEMHFLAMEYVDGQTLDALVEAAGPVAAGRAVELMLMAAAGLQHAYEKGFVHRDIKPGNLIVGKDGVLKILDMGLARSQEIGDKLTEILDKGAVVGTADYISPEQAVNSPDLDIRADIYSLGATFFTVVAGRPPFEGNTTQKLVQHQMKDAPPLTAIDKTFPPGLAAVVAKMLKKKPADRFQTPADLINALAPWLPNTPRVVATLSRTNLGTAKAMQKTMAQVAKGSTGRLPRVRKGSPRRSKRPLYAGLGVVAALALVGGLVYALSGPSQPKAVPPVAPDPTPALTPAPSPKHSELAPPGVGPTPSIAVPKQSGVVYQLNLAGAKPYTEVGKILNDPATPAARWLKDQAETKGAGPFPPGWQPSATETGASYRGEVRPGPPASLFANSTLLAPELPTGSGRLKLAVTLKSDKPVAVRFRPTRPRPGPAVACGTLAASAEFAPRELELNLPPGRDGRLEFVAEGESGLALAGFTLTDPVPPAGRVLLALDAGTLKPFVQKTRNFKQPGSTVALTVISQTGPGKLPDGWYRWISQPGAVAEFFAEGEPGAVALGVRVVSGGGSVQVNTPEFAAPEGRVRFRMLYATGPQSPGAVARFRPKSGAAIWDAVDLPPTGGSWRLAEAEVDLRGETRGLFELTNPAEGADAALLIREFGVRTPGP